MHPLSDPSGAACRHWPLMAMLFMLEEKLLHQQSLPLLSCSDIECLLAHFLPRRDTSLQEVVRQMEARHEARRRSIESAYQRQQRRDEAEAQAASLLTRM